MKISFFTSLNDGGISTYSKRLIASLHTVAPNMSVQIVGLTSPFRIYWNIKKYFQARALYKELGEAMNNADIAHIQHEYSLFCLWINPFENMYRVFRRKIHIPTIITVHEIVERNIQEGGSMKTKIKYFLKKQYYKIFSRYMQYIEVGMFEECSAVIVHTNEAKKTLIKRGVNEEKIHVIFHGIPHVTLSKNTKEEDKRKLGLEGKKVITTFGFIPERNGQDIVLSILDNLPQDVVYLIAGSVLGGMSSQYGENIEKMIKEKKLENKVKITGFVEEESIPIIMNATDIIVAPFRDITASGSLSEAIAYAKPIIATNLPFIREINENGGGIETFPLGDEYILQEKITMLLEDEKKRKALEESTHEYAQKYNYDAAALKTKQVYEYVFAKI